MKPEFSYSRKNGRDSIRVLGMSYVDVAIEIAYIARKFYATLMRRDPGAAQLFKSFVLRSVTNPATWDVSDSPLPELEVVIPVDISGSK